MLGVKGTAAHCTSLNSCLPWRNLQWEGWSIYLWCWIAAWDLRRKWNLPWICTKVWRFQWWFEGSRLQLRESNLGKDHVIEYYIHSYRTSATTSVTSWLVKKLVANIDRHGGMWHVHVERGKTTPKIARQAEKFVDTLTFARASFISPPHRVKK